ncbi:MAG: peptidylprolyl isomerase, partial [Proteobacteria bacterium]|nr:peptidylprolyl isomerase [Pseudomonadota bacterium]
MKRAKPGDIVSIEYKGVLENGEIFESTEEIGPLEFTLGTGSVMPAFEMAVVGMSVGESNDIVLQPKDGYGERQQELLQTIDKNVFGNKAELKIGQILYLNTEKEGKTHKVPATVIELADTTVTLDYNHPLAGHVLTYKVTLKHLEQSKEPMPIVTGPAGS